MPRLKIKKELDGERREENDANNGADLTRNATIKANKAEQSVKQGEGRNPSITKVYDFVITASLILMFLGLPLFFTNMTLQGLGFEKQMYFYIILLVGLFAWVIKAIAEGHILIKRTPLDIPIIIFLLAILGSSIFSVNKWASFMGGWGIPAKSFISILAMALFYWFMISNITMKRLNAILAAFATSIGLICFIFILNFFSLNLIGWVLGAIGLKIQPNAVWMNGGFNTIGLLSNLEIFISAAILIIVGILGSLTHPPSQRGVRGDFSMAGSGDIGNDGTRDGSDDSKVIRAKALEIDQDLRAEKSPRFADANRPPLEKGADQPPIPRPATSAGRPPLIKGVTVVLLYGILLACLFVILVLGSYVSLIGLLVGLGVILTLAMSRLVDMDKKIFSINSFLFALVLVYIIIGKTPIQLKPLPSEIGLSRSISWQISKEGFKDKYLLGAGLGNFEYVFNKHKPKTFNDNVLWNTRFSEATGIFYEAFATLGGIGVAALILLILTFLGVCLYIVVKRNANERELENESAGIGCADILFVALFAASVSLGIDMALYLTGGVLIIFACLLAALVMSVISLNKPKYFKELFFSYKVKPEYALALSFVFVCLSCGIILLFITLGKIYLADVYAKKALTSENEEVALRKISNAIKLFPYQYMYYEKMGDLMALAGDKEMKNEKRDMEKVQNLLINAINSHKKAISLSPESAFSWENLGVVSEAIVKYDPTLLNDAENSYKKAIELDPNNPALRMRIGMIKEAKAEIAAAEENKEGEKDKESKEAIKVKLYNGAIEDFEKAIELKPDLTSAYDGVSRIKEKNGDLEKAIEYMTVSFNLNANNAFYPFNLGRLYYNMAAADMAEKRTADPAEEGNADTGEFNIASSTEGIKVEENSKIVENKKAIDSENDLKIAEALFKRAVQLQDKYVDALYSLAMVYEKQGMISEAKEYYKKTLDSLPENAAETRKMLEKKIGSM
ncbi:MAG: hypothetical protein V1891_02605 [bacterium]